LLYVRPRKHSLPAASPEKAVYDAVQRLYEAISRGSYTLQGMEIMGLGKTSWSTLEVIAYAGIQDYRAVHLHERYNRKAKS